MVERLTDQERILRMVVGSVRWWSILSRGKARHDECPVRQLVLSASFWDSAHLVQDVMRPTYSLLRSMGTDGSSPTTLWTFVESIAARVHDMGLPEADETEIMERVNYRWGLMRQSAYALAYLVGLRRRDAKHGVYPARWWYLHGSDFPRLQEVAIKVLAMWSTVSPCDRNWTTHDFIYAKRRNRLSSDSLGKLVFIHCNMQLLRVQSTIRKGYVDVWADMVEKPLEPAVGDPSEEVYAEGMSIPEEVEADMHTRPKEGGDCVSVRLLQAQDDYDVEDEDAIYDADDVWARKDMIEEIAVAWKGKEKVHDDPLVSRVWDTWGGLDVVEDLNGFLHGCRHTLHIVKDIEECRRSEGSSRQVDEGHHVDTGFHSTVFDGEADCNAAATDVGLTRIPQMAVASHDREEVCPGVDEQEAALDTEEQEEAAMTHEQSCLIAEEMGRGQTEHASPPPTILEMSSVVGEGERGRELDESCDMETGTEATAAHPRSTLGRDVMAQLGSEPETEREVQTLVQPPPIAEHVAPASTNPPPTFKSIEAQRALTTMIGESLVTAASSSMLRPMSFYTARPLPVLHRSVVVRGPGLAIPLQ
ncbi:hypothetical protein CBR_g29681 [Chara braunii]|uniref:HAT C-terminal dimerisation domain-containing protein n=1 Tax=Chara braunii TaxID=69332 RepID=A0A388LB75_CHABU|nr:hypothetical protein CBR_g29681 [Chara braunii]|eukprot:GBG79534.1 hypothetical protein CBR_g29681 [Chara braunii]